MEIIDQVACQHRGIAHSKALGHCDLRNTWSQPWEFGGLGDDVVAVHDSAHEYPVVAVLREVVIQFCDVGVVGERSRGWECERLKVVTVRYIAGKGVRSEELIRDWIALQDRLHRWIRARPLGASTSSRAVWIEQTQRSWCQGYEKVGRRHSGG